MEMFNGLESYWRRRTYRRLERSPSSKKRVVRLGNRRSWKLRVVRPMFRLRLRIPSPMKLLCRVRDAYVDVMMALAGEKQRAPLSAAKKGGKEGVLMQRSVSKALQISKTRSDFERKMMIHIYNGLVAPREVLSSVSS